MNPTPQKWRLDRDAFERLLQALGPDRETASREYEALRRRLVHFFDWRNSPAPEAQADETLDRLARKLQAGEMVENVQGYARAVARHVLQEAHRDRARERAALEEIARAEPPATSDEADARLRCLATCLEQLPESSRTLVIEYYRGKGRVHLAERTALAGRLGMTYSGLKMRAHRARAPLEDCVRACMDGGKTGNR